MEPCSWVVVRWPQLDKVAEVCVVVVVVRPSDAVVDAPAHQIVAYGKYIFHYYDNNIIKYFCGGF